MILEICQHFFHSINIIIYSKSIKVSYTSFHFVELIQNIRVNKKDRY